MDPDCAPVAAPLDTSMRPLPLSESAVRIDTTAAASSSPADTADPAVTNTEPPAPDASPAVTDTEAPLPLPDAPTEMSTPAALPTADAPVETVI